jgi:hypothetical protein
MSKRRRLRCNLILHALLRGKREASQRGNSDPGRR